jgi:tRNA dimethylallyltransferase
LEEAERNSFYSQGKPSKPKVILITGPTGIGKTKVAIELARSIKSEIISADSMQVYRYMDIGTDKPDVSLRNEIVHHLIDIINPDEDFNAAIFRRIASPLIEKLWKEGKYVIVAGGTGLYIKVLFGGLINGVEPQMELRKRYIEESEKKGREFLYQKLLELDRDAAKRIHPHDTFRIIRALEIIEKTGKPLSIQQNLHRFSHRPYDVLKIGLMIEREKLYKEIDKRVDRMIERGLVDEVRRLLQMGYGLHNRSMRSIGYRHISYFLLGEWDFIKAVTLMKRDTRRYAKRQITWFGSDNEFQWHKPYEFNKILEKVKKFLGI